MDLYYIANFDVWAANTHLFEESHFVYTDEKHVGSEIIFICARFRHKADEARWRAQPSVEPLPHPLDPNGYLRPMHAEVLKHFGITTGHRTIEAAGRVAQLHALFEFSGI